MKYTNKRLTVIQLNATWQQNFFFVSYGVQHHNCLKFLLIIKIYEKYNAFLLIQGINSIYELLKSTYVLTCERVCFVCVCSNRKKDERSKKWMPLSCMSHTIYFSFLLEIFCVSVQKLCKKWNKSVWHMLISMGVSVQK